MDVYAFFPVFPGKLLRHFNTQLFSDKPGNAGKLPAFVPVFVPVRVKFDTRRQYRLHCFVTLS
jgi:hypothetical protein